MKLVRDVLDKQIRGRDGEKLGKVDGIILELREGEPPRVAYLELGSATMARRISRRLERWAIVLNRKLGVRRPRYRIAFDRVLAYEVDVKVDIDTRTSPAFAWERWFRDHIIRRIPPG